MRNHLDLFSGIGGFALAAKWTGWNTIGFSEIDPYASAVLKKHWPEVPNYGDIKNVCGIKADLVTGGFPCQPFSVAGKRGGASDDRALWPEMRRVIADARPAWVLAENVPGIISMELDNCISDLEGIGYTVAPPLVIGACAVDASHRRMRVWILAHSNGARSEARLPKPKEQEDRHAEIPDHDNRRNGRQAIWCPEPGLVRLVPRVPNRAHRLRCLGNAIVPQVAKEILKLML